MNVGYVYEIRLISNPDRNYIGQTHYPDRRWNEHKRDAKNGRTSCPHLHNAIRKYGMARFEFLIVDIAANQEELDSLECFYKTLLGDYYGIKEGGFGGKHSDETKKKISKSLIGNHNGVGSTPWNKGKSHLAGKDNPNWKGGRCLQRIRYCPGCDKKLVYTTYQGIYIAKKKNSKCLKCSKRRLQI